jgi:hypothetical protein
VSGVFLQGVGARLVAGQFWLMALIGLINLMPAGWLFRHRI